MSNYFEWGPLAFEPQLTPQDPWALWVRLRPGSNRTYPMLCESTDRQRPTVVEGLDWRVPTVYADDAAFFTASGSVKTFLTAEEPVVFGQLGPGIGSFPSIDHVVDSALKTFALKSFAGLSKASIATLPLVGSPSLLSSLVNIQLDLKPKPKNATWQIAKNTITAETLALESASLNHALLKPNGAEAVRATKGPVIAVPKAGQSKAPVIGVVDTGIGFLNMAFRKSSSKTRLLSFWIQDEDRFDGNAATAPWRRPPELGYGRELPRDQIDKVLARIDAGQVTEAAAYLELHTVSKADIPDWTHGTQVLALLAGTPDPLSVAAGNLGNDFAAGADIVAVQLPDEVIQRTHGNWLSALVLDALHYILARAPAAAPVVINLSLGAYSGAHEQTGMLNRAIDALITAQNGRLTVVVAAGNARTWDTHARSVVKPGAEAVFSLKPRGDDPTPTFIEVWCEAATTAAGPIKVTAQFEVDRGPPTTSESVIKSDQIKVVSGGEPIAQVMTAPGHSDRNNVALLCGCGDPPDGHNGLQLLAGIAPRVDSSMGIAPPGTWALEVHNDSDADVAMNAWIARDDAIDGARDTLPFDSETLNSNGSRNGTMSNLAWARNVVTVGGYVTNDEYQPRAMFDASGAGFSPNEFESKRRRVGPDACGPASVDGTGVAPVAFFTDDEVEDPQMQVGTSMAAPVLARQLVNILGAKRAFLDKTQLLAALAVAKPGHAARPAGQEEWTSSYWLPLT
jgi:hypothetical protein